MELKEQVLRALEENKGETISGEELSKKLFVTRSAIWKAVSSLRKDGYAISAVTNKGYMLSSESDILSSTGINAYLSEKAKRFRFDIRESVGSTNTELKSLAQNGEKAGLVLIAKKQTNGKGRRGRSFYSPNQTGVYFSILIRPKITLDDSLLITTSTAVAVSKAIEKLSDKKAMIKWVNDIFVDNKKVCGILTEASLDMECGGLDYAVVGIGVNLSKPIGDFADEIKDIAGGFLDDIKGNIRCRLIAEILNEFANQMSNITSRAYLDEYRKRCFLIEKQVYVIKSDSKTKALVLDIDDKARLHVKYENGETEYLSSGEVSIKLN